MTRILLVTLLLLGAGLTGCLGKDDAPVAQQDVDTGTNISDVPPDGRDGKLIAFEETNATESGVGGVDHHHDLWNGQSRVVLFEVPASMEPYDPLATFRPEMGKIIYEGTQTVEFTISKPQRRVCPYGGTFDGDYACTDNAGKIARGFGVPAPADGAPRADDPQPPTGLKLRYKHSSTVTWIDVGVLTWDTPLPIKINHPRETDMPHATNSLWEFQVESPNTQDVTLTFTAKAELVRGDADIPLWPGHPDFYAEQSIREVLRVDGREACDQTGCTMVSNQDNVGPVAAQKLISYGTKTLHVWLNITDAQFPVPATKPQSWFLYHNNATGLDNVTDQFDQDAYGIDKREFYWALPVDDGAMDSPYADGSRWVFDLGAALVTPALSCYGNCADWYAKYNLVVLATNEELPLEQYHNYCLRDEDCAYAAQPTA